MAARATWKGFLRLGELVSAVALYTGVSASERVSLHMVNRRSGHRLSRRFVDGETGAVVERDDQVKGYEVASGDYLVLEPEEIAEVTPKGDKTLSIESFIPCGQVDDLYFDRPYYLQPADKPSQASFALIREGLRARQVAAVATAVLFRRPRSLLIRAYDDGIIATTLNYDYEVRSAQEAFADIRDVAIEPEMLDLARHIIETKAGRFQPESFDDRYDAALAELVRAKIAGRKITPPKKPAGGKVVNLLDALRESAKMADKGGDKGATGKAGGKGGGKSGGKSGATKKARSAGARKPARAAPARKAG
ncbi:non-homologous end joining protein Ku [Ancylobacter terrae]|uniref:non-homologous end joining protein Ku n=1 Tax=Ancylobacter sp. sgz301288 TaxID=3342077 RepID=UPI00385F8B32